MTFAKPNTTLSPLLNQWKHLLQQWAKGGSLATAAQEALLLSGIPEGLQILIDEWAAAVFKSLPEVELLSTADINGAMGAYAISTGKIYLNENWLDGAKKEEVFAVLTEELGHHLDGLLNSSDSPGDEGELLARLLVGEGQLDSKQLMAICRQDDSGTVWIDRKLLNVENSAVLEFTPKLAWARQFGSVGNDSADDITTGNDGSIYIGGFSEGNLDGQTNSGKRDGFISKYNSDGIKVWTKLIVVDGQVSDLTTGKDGAIYVSGNLTNNGIWGGFVSKYNSDGNKEWTKLSPPSSWSAYALTTGIDSAIYVSGYASSSIEGQVAIGLGDAFISKYNPDGTKVWSRLLGTSKTDFSTDLTTGSDGSIYICGDTDGNLDGQTNSGLRDAFISKYSTDGSRAWTKTIGTNNEERSRALTTGKDGSIYICGETEGNLDGQTNSGLTDAFISKYSTDGSRAWTRLLGTSSHDSALALTTGIDGSIYVSGGTNGNLDGENDVGAYGAFISKYNSNGSKLWTKIIGSSNADSINSLQIGSDGAIYVSGITGGKIDGQTNSGGFDAYISKYYPDDGKSNSESVDTSALPIAAVASTKLTAGDFATPANINLSLPAYVMSTNWNIDKYYYYVEQYPMTLRTAFYADYLAGRYTNQALYGQNHYLTGGQAEGRSMPGTDGILPDSNDYGAYVENYGITLLDIYRVDSRAVVNGGTMSLFAWGKEHYTNWGKAEGREISGGVEWGGIVRNNLDLYNQWQDAKLVTPTLSAFAFGFQRQNTIKSTLGVLVGSDTADKLTGQIAYGLNGNDVICSDGGRGILAGGFGDDLLVAANGGSDLAYGGPGSDIFQLNAGSTFNIRDFRKGADMIQLGSTLTSTGVTMQWDSADNSTLFYNGSSVIGKVYGKRPTEFTYSDSTNGVSKVYI